MSSESPQETTILKTDAYRFAVTAPQRAPTATPRFSCEPAHTSRFEPLTYGYGGRR